jgi:hypothetical protein
MKPLVEPIEQFLEPSEADELQPPISTEPIASRSQVIEAVSEVAHIITSNGVLDEFHAPRLVVKET